MSDFVNPKTGKPDDAAWLDVAIHKFVDAPSPSSRSPKGKSEEQIYEYFAPTSSYRGFRTERPSWESKIRVVRRDMIAASIRRLLEDGRLRVSNPDLRRNHYLTVLQTQILGGSWKAPIRQFETGTVLDRLAEVL